MNSSETDGKTDHYFAGWNGTSRRVIHSNLLDMSPQYGGKLDIYF
jgi:hypothetical protein